MKTKTYEPRPGEDITETAHSMFALAAKENCRVKATFNDIGLIIGVDGRPEDITRYFYEECERRRKAYDESPEGRASQKRAEESKKQAAKAEEAGILPFELTDRDGWQKCVANNNDGYGACCVRYAARWANLMEKEIKAGKKLERIAKRCSNEADLEGITGFMYGAAVSMLAHCWVHGEALRRWHNLDSQIGNEGEKANESGGTLNPALLTIGEKTS